METAEQKRALQNALRIVIRYLDPNTLTIDELIVQMKRLGFSDVSRETLAREANSLLDGES